MTWGKGGSPELPVLLEGELNAARQEKVGECSHKWIFVSGNTVFKGAYITNFDND